MKEFFYRLFFSVFFISLVVILLLFANNLCVSVFLAILIAFLASVGILEYCKLAKQKNYHVSSIIPIIFSILFIFSIYTLHFFDIEPIFSSFILVIALFCIWVSHFKAIENAISNVAISFFGLCYVAVPLGMMLSLLYPPQIFGAVFDGRLAIGFLLLVTKMTDIGAYFSGKLFKGRKIASQISPGKTASGAIGGIFFSILSSYIFYQLGLKGLPLSLFDSIFLGIAIGVISQFGDLAESLLKRDAKVKDSSSLPGLGGVLDILDSLLFTTPLVYFFIYL